MAPEADVDVGGHTRAAADRRAPLLHAPESDPGHVPLRRVRRRALPAILRGRGPAGAAAGALLPAAADWLFRRPGLRARDRVACGGFVCPARISRIGVAG